MNTELEIQLY